MPGNRAIYDRALEQSREAARQRRWDEALKGAVRALQEFPQDVDARTAAAVALFNTNKLAQALQILEELRAVDPENPFFLGYIAQANERNGNTAAAVEAYCTLADLHQNQRRMASVIEALRAALQLRPDMDAQRERLARLLEETNAPRDAAAEYFTLARMHYELGRLDEAASYAETVLRLDVNSREAKELLIAIREAMARAANDSSVEDVEAQAESRPVVSSMAGMTGALRSQQFALEKLVAVALEKQEAGDMQGAIESYEKAVNAGLERADVFYSLGLLYQEHSDHQKAVTVLTRAAMDPEYALSSHFALGSSYKELNQLPQAAQEYEKTIRLVDLESIGKTEADDLVQMYENAAGIYEQIGDIARAATLYSTLANFLQGKRWGKERAAEFSQRAKHLTERNMFAKLRNLGTGALTPLPDLELPPQTEEMPQTWGKIRPITDFLRADRASTPSDKPAVLVEPPPPLDPLDILNTLPAPEKSAFAPVMPLDTTGFDEQLERWVVASEKYIEQGLLEAALDACHDVIRLDMAYLPIHLRMGEIYERQGRPEEALTKYQLLIDTYMVRDEPTKAIDVYFRLIDLSPDTINARTRLADLLKNAGRIDEAAEQLKVVAATYFRLGQTNKSLEEYRRLIQWAPKNKDIHAQYGQVLLKLERYEAALVEFRKALDLGSASDPTTIAWLNMTLALMAEQPVAVWDSLATLLDQIKAQPQLSNAIQPEYRAVLLVTDSAVLHYILGIIQQQSNQHSSALLEFDQAFASLEADTDPLLTPVLIHQAMADSYIALGRAEEALEQLRHGQAVAGQSRVNSAIKHSFAVPLSQGDLVRRMAEAYAASDDLVGAERALLEARRLLPYDRAVYTKLADVYFRQGKLNEALAQLEDLATHYEGRQDLDRAIETLEYGLKLAPSNIQLGSRLARLQLRRGFLAQGVEGLVRVADLQRKAGQLKDAIASLQEAAQVHWMLSEHEQARILYDRIVQIAPNDVEARQWLSLMHTLAGRTAEAIAEKKQIVRILAQQRDYDAAIAELTQIIAMDKKDMDTYYIYGDMLMRREEYGQAVRNYTRMLNMDGVDTDRVEALLSAANRMLSQQQQTRSSQ
jgi:tetratricopeptide (TPR) repeat protein